ncbi:hypothetical protein KC342_g5644 [Hortaea werneckii]|nr:hypothetical protein KC342_g5644 [Hortaea werneckii]
MLSIQASGDEVAVGDAIAQTSLAEILLRFNTGIVQIISYFLERDNGDIVHLDYRSLTDLSDLSRLETCRVLQQLCVRLSQRGSRPLPDSRRAARDEISRREDSSKISGHSIARVVIQGSSKPPQLIQPNPPPSALLSPLKNLVQTPQQKLPFKQPNPPPITPLHPTPTNLIQTSQTSPFNNQPTPSPLIPPFQSPSATGPRPRPPRPRPDLLLAGLGPDEAGGDSAGAVAGGV